MGTAAPPRTWPADIIHVNEDGWVLINRGRADGVAIGLRVLVVGSGKRELRDLFANGAPATGGQGDANEDAPVVLRTRRTYELLEIVHVEPRCAVAIASRTPAQRRPEFYAGPTGELLVWVPLPVDYTWPQPGESSGDESGASDDSDDVSAEQPAADGGGADDVDAPPGNSPQEDERWEAALPINGVNVGDVVILAVPAAAAAGVPAMGPTGAGSVGAATAASDSPSAEQETPGTASSAGTWDKTYDWMHPKSE